MADDSVIDSEIKLFGYVVQRKDSERSDGGVCMFTMSDLAIPRNPWGTKTLHLVYILLPLSRHQWLRNKDGGK